MLGGGHGYLQGQYGLVTDQLVEARMVLANGKAATVSPNSYPDLFWGIRGAGHNFGIVTESKHKIYDVLPNSTWAYEAFTFTGDKLESLYSLTNEMMKTQPAHVMHWGVIRRIPAIDAVHASRVPHLSIDC
jgi:FAD/FMN-containing dehydrogenase